MKNKIFSVLAIFIGTVVGAGIFGVPFVIAKIGFVPGIIYMLALAVSAGLLMVMYGEVILRTKGYHQSTGYAEKYLGKWGKYLMSFSFVFGVYGALLAYMIGVGEFAYILLGESLGGSPVLYTTIFFVLASVLILIGLGMIIKIEKGMFVLLLLVMGAMFVFGVKYLDFDNLHGFNVENIFLPYGVLFFAFTGFSAIPSMSLILKGNKNKLKSSIIIGSAVVFFIYLIFSIIIVGIAGENTSEEAISGLTSVLGNKIVLIGAIFGILTMTTSFLTLGLALKEMYEFDFKMNKTLAWVVTCFVPFIVFILGFASFVEVLGIVGAVTGGLMGILTLMMYRKSRKFGDRKPEYQIKIPKIVELILYLIFGLGIIYQIYFIFFN